MYFEQPPGLPYRYNGSWWEVMYSDRFVSLKYLNGPIREGADPYDWTTPWFSGPSVFQCPDVPPERGPIRNYDTTRTFIRATRVMTHYAFTYLGSRLMYHAGTEPEHTWSATSYGYVGPETVDRPRMPSQFIIGGDMGTDPWEEEPANVLDVWYAIGLRVWDLGPNLTTSPKLYLAHNGKFNVMYLDGSAGVAPQVVRDLSKIDGDLSAINETTSVLPEAEKAARYFHPNPPAIWPQ
jgi:prepilin-type processing-associated H-X9-DG protein